MGNREILDILKDICIRSELEDLDPEFFPIIGNEEDGRICMFFILDGILYHGSTTGNLDYYPLGICSELVRILYRLYEEDGTCEFCFEFLDYRIVLSHESFYGSKATLNYEYEFWKDEKEIKEFLRERTKKQ